MISIVRSHSQVVLNHRFARGEGAVVIVLKPLPDALRDHDHIYGVVSETVRECADVGCLMIP